MKDKKLLILRIILGVSLVLLAFFSALPMLPARVITADAPATHFSAERAMADLEVIASEPHAAGSAAQERVRSYIIGQVEALGLIAEIETSGRIANILVRLPGTDSTRTVLITGHYDSHPPAPGAGDNGISTVAMLESIRALHASQSLRNDVLFLFTDGEELGWLGARAFLKQHPEAKNETGVTLVFDARPGNAPLTLLETSPGDAWLIRQMTGLPLSLWAGSWNNREERTEQDTDFDIFQPGGLIGAAFENEASGTRYHSERDTVSAISPNLVQSYGQSMLALASRFGTIDLRTRTESPDAAYFTLPLVGIVTYPGWLMPVLSSLGILTLIVFVVVAWRQGIFLPGHFGLSLLGLALGIGTIVLCAQLAWGGVKNLYAAESVAGGMFEASSAWLTGMMLAAALLMISLLVFLSRRLGGINLLTAGVTVYLLIWFAVYFLMEADNPLTTDYIAWPLLGGVAGLGILLFTKNPVYKVVFLVFCALAILMLQVPYMWLGRYTSEDAWIAVLAVCIPMGLFVPQVEAIFGQALK